MTAPNPARNTMVGSVARLLLAGALAGRDAAVSVLASSGPEDPPAEGIALEADGSVDGSPSPPDATAPVPLDAIIEYGPMPMPPGGTEETQARHILIGLASETGERVERRAVSMVRRATGATATVSSPAVGWARQTRLLAPARRRLEAARARGDARLAGWAARGRLEESRSRAMLQTTATQTLDTAVDSVVHNPEVQDMVRTQSRSVAQDAADEMRVRVLRADFVLERPVRWLLRRKPGEELARGGFASRLIAFFIDIIVIRVAFLSVEWILVGLTAETGIQTPVDWFEWSLPVSDTAAAIIPMAVLFSAFYFLFFWTATGWTIGKVLMGLRVVRKDGSRLSFGRALVRLFGYVLSTALWCMGFWWILLDKNRRGWHDYLAGTFVVHNLDEEQQAGLRTDSPSPSGTSPG